MKKALALVSGGLDSCVTAAIANENYQLAFIHLNYGQRTEKRELYAFHKIAEFYGVKEKLIIDSSHFSKMGSSSLTDRSIKVSRANLESTQIPSSYVPFRNGNILAMAGSFAEVIGASALFIGAVQEDSSGYPDCREDFFRAFETALNLGTKPETTIKIETPIIHLSKKEIILRAKELKAPLELTWSCYQNEQKACGICDSCALRLRGFKEAGIEDPIEYTN
jgi:7-cyano-7-deazaguanine synthase